MLAQHPQPTRGVALHHGRLVVDLRVSMALAMFKYAVDGSQHLMGGGDRGASVAASNLQVAVIAVELAVFGSGGGQGALDENAAQVRLARRLPALLLLPGNRSAQAVFDELVEPPDPVVQLLPGGEVFLEQEAGAVGQLGIQCVAQLVTVPLDMSGQRIDDRLWRATADKLFNDPLAIDSEQVGEDTADAQAGAVQGLMDAVADARSIVHQLATLVWHVAQFAELRRRHEAGSAETERADACQPDAVGDIGLAALDLLDMLGVEHQRLDAGLFQVRMDMDSR